MKSVPSRRSALFVAVAVAALLAAACVQQVPPEPPGPPPPGTWQVTPLLHDPTPGAVVAHPYTATNSAWWAVLDMPGLFEGDATLQLYARSGADGAPAPTPSQSIPLGQYFLGLAMSDHVLAIEHYDAVANAHSVELYELDPGTNTWAFGSTVPADDLPAELDLDVTDNQLVMGAPVLPGPPGGPEDGTVVVVPISLAGPGITWSSGSITALGPDPSWSSADRLGFGRRVSVEGDTLAVSAGEDHVRLYTWGGTSYAVAATLVDPAPATTGTFGESISVDTSTGQARVLIGITGTFNLLSSDPPKPGRVELWVRNGAVWSLKTTIPPRPGANFGGLFMGNTAALDGRWAVVGFAYNPVPDGGSGTVEDQRLEIYDLWSGSPMFEREISPVDETGGVFPGQQQAVPLLVDVVGSHIVCSVYTSAPGANQFSALSVDRHPIP